MATRIESSDAQDRLPELLDRTAQQGERFILERNGQPTAAVVALSDLERLESAEASRADRRVEERRLMQAAAERLGIVIHWPSGEDTASSDFKPIEIDGPPVSEDIIADRR